VKTITTYLKNGKRIHPPHTGKNWPTRAPFDRSALDEAKRRLTISAAWHALGLTGEPRRVCCSPFREERHASFSIEADRLWHDFSSGEGGDVVSFVKRATACTDRKAIETVLDLAGLGTGKQAAPVKLAPRQVSAMPARAKFDGLQGLALTSPTMGEIIAIAEVRNWPVFLGLELAARRGLLRMADFSWRGEKHRCWILTDDARLSAQARRLDGGEWPEAGKSLSLRSDDDHPPGLADVVKHDRPAVLLCEGEPDAIAALTFAWLADVCDEVGIVCLTGASRPLSPAVLEKLRGRRVRILRQADKPDKNGVKHSHRAALVWLNSLAAAGIACDVANLDGLTRADGLPAKDVADLLRRPNDHETLQPLADALLGNLLK
jgi:hypothetical protein